MQITLQPPSYFLKINRQHWEPQIKGPSIEQENHISVCP